MKKKYILESSIKTARLSRLIAKGIDLFIVLLLSMLFYPFGLLVSIFYLSVADSMHGGQSVGKRFIGFAVISLEDGMPCSVKQSFIRNLPLIIPPCVLLEIYLLFKLDSGHRLGDVMADTTVIGNDPDRIDLQKAQESWFKNSKNGMSPCNKTLM